MLSFLQEAFFTSLTAAFLVAAAAWLARTAISERLRRSIQYEFDEKLEAVKAAGKESEARLAAELKLQDTRLQAELRGKDQQLHLLQSEILSARASRQSALDTRRLEAIDSLWASFNDLAPLQQVARFMQVIKYDAALGHAAGDAKTREFFAGLSRMAGVSPETLQARAEDSPWRARLYVTDEAWKLFEAYRGVLHVLLIRLKQLENGVPKDFTKVEETISEVRAALPTKRSSWNLTAAMPWRFSSKS